MLIMDGQVTLHRRRPVNHRLPLRPARQLRQRHIELVGTVVGKREPGSSRRAHPSGLEILAVVQDGPPEEVGHPRELPGELRDRKGHEQAVAQLARHRAPFRSQPGHDDRHLDRARGGVARRMEHAHPSALPLDRLAAQQPAVGADVGVHVRPGNSAIAHRPASGKTRAEGDGDAVGRERRKRGGGRRIDHRVAQRGNQNARAKADALSSLRRQREHHPHIRALLRRVIQPGAPVPQLLSERDVLGRVERRRKCA